MMATGSSGAVVLDTGVFGSRLCIGAKSLFGSISQSSPAGQSSSVFRPSVNSATAQLGLAGANARLARLERLLADVEVVWAGPDLAVTYALLRARCVQAGHALGDKIHDGDRWIAATAIHLDVPLVAHDRIFKGAPGLRMETALGDDI